MINLILLSRCKWSYNQKKGGARMKYFLAVDIGASSGRHFITWKNENDELEYKEIFRFKNGLEKRNSHLCWNLEGLFTNIKEGLKECKKQGVIPESLGIDTWGCDFVLLDSEGKILGDSVAYRDNRTEGYMEKLNSLIGAEELYQRTGIQRQPFNTIYQLMSIKDKNPEILEKANNFLMIPDYFHYLLSGQFSNEYTNATTTALVNTETKDWDWELIKLLGFPDEGEFSGQTRFLTMQEIFKDAKSVMDRLRFSIEDDFTALMLMTDGVSDPMFETDNNLNSTAKWDEFWDKLHDGFKDDEIPGVDLSDDNEESKYQLLRWLDFWSPGNHDDRTIAILY